VHGENGTLVGAFNNEIVCQRSEEIIYYLTASDTPAADNWPIFSCMLSS
jgi:hypothetical protein